MARHVVQSVTDDLDGTPDAAEVEFSLDGRSWTIDLGPKNEAALRNLVQPYIDAGRKIAASGGRGGARRGGSSRVADPDRSRTIREWALANGVELPARGRIAQGYQEAYDAGDVALLYQAAGLELPEADKPKRRKKTDAQFSSAV